MKKGLPVMEQPDPIMLSALEYYAYCPGRARIETG